MFEPGDRIVHPSKPEWGIAEVLSQSTNVITVWFEEVGKKKLSLTYVKPMRVFGKNAKSKVLQTQPWESNQAAEDTIKDGAKTRCKNCGQNTVFNSRSSPARVDLGWCEPCMRQSQRKFVAKENNETIYYDDYKTIDGIRTRYNAK